MKRVPVVLLCFLFLLFFGGALARAQVIVAEDLLVELDATAHPTNEVINVITNTGTMGGVFEANGPAATIPETINIGGSGTRAIRFDGLDYMQHVDAPGGSPLLAHPGLVSTNPTVTIEAWVINNTIVGEETIVAWGRRGGPCGSNMAFNYGDSPDHGAVGHWCGQDIGWGAIGTPAPGLWHHLVYTYDGTTTKVYVDGQLTNSEVLGGGAIVTHTNTPITLAAQLEASTAVNDGLRGSLAIGRLRIHDGVLSDFEVNQNYQLEVGDFSLGSAAPLTVGPVHRYSFNNPNGSATNGTTVIDSVGGAHATVQGDNGVFANGLLSVPGGSYLTAAYVDIPNGLLSTNGANNGGSGQVTFEGWNVMRGNNVWGRLFDFGSSSAGEITGVGTVSGGLDYFALTRQLSGDDTRKRVEIREADPVFVTTEILDFESFTPANSMYHYAVTWDEASGQVKVYENGIETAGYVTSVQFSDINDVNNWLARGQFSNDQVLNIDLDEFRIYDYVLSPEQVAANAQFGPDVVFIDPGPLQAVRLEVAHTNVFPGTDQQVVVFADFLNVTNIEVTASNTTYQVSDAGVLQVNSNGLVQALALGSADLRAVFGGMTNSVTMQVVEPSATLIHRYSFDNAADDSVGGAHGTFVNGATNLAGKLVLNAASNHYVALPPFIVSPTFALTVEAFADFGTNSTFVRLFDFGDQNQGLAGRKYAFFSPTGPGGFAWSEMSKADPGSPEAQVVSEVVDLNGATNVHVVAVYHPAARSMQLYLDGCLVAERNDINVTAMSELDDKLNWIGRSLFSNDGYLNAEIDELRIYDGVMPVEQVAVSRAVGPDTLPPADPGNVTAVQLAGAETMLLETTQQLAVWGDLGAISNVNLCGFDMDYSSDNEQVVTVSSKGVVTALREGTATVTAMIDGVSGQLTITTQREGRLTLVHRYPFDAHADDVIGRAHGVLSNNTGSAVYTNGTLQLNNDAAQRSNGLGGNFVELPDGMISVLGSNVTFEIWHTWEGPADSIWQRIFDFGISDGGDGISSAATGTPYIFLTPRGGPGSRIFGYQVAPDGIRQERRVTDTAAANVGEETHYAIVWNGVAGTVSMYVNGTLSGTGALHMQLSDLNDANNWLGRAQWNDPYLTGALDEFRIYQGAMNGVDIADSFAAGPNGLVTVEDTMLSIQRLPDQRVRIAWPVDPAGFGLQSADAASGVFTNSPLPVAVEGSENAVYPSADGSGAFKVYRLVK